MNGRNAKMLRRVQKDTKEGKRDWNSFTAQERAEIRADYEERGDEAKAKFRTSKKMKKKEAIIQSVADYTLEVKESEQISNS